MSARRLQAPAFGLSPNGGAVTAPAGFQIRSTGGLAWVDGDDCVHQDLLLLLLTSPGERVMRPDYGCHLRRLLFQPNDETLAGLAIHYVRQAVDRFEPRVRVLELDAGAGAGLPAAQGDARREPNVLGIRLDYEVRLTARRRNIEIGLDLADAATTLGSTA